MGSGAGYITNAKVILRFRKFNTGVETTEKKNDNKVRIDRDF